MMAQGNEAVVRFLAEEAVSLVLGFLGGAAYLPLPSLRREGGKCS